VYSGFRGDTILHRHEVSIMLRQWTIGLSIVVVLGSTCFSDEAPRRKILVEFGWDEPDTAFLKAHLAEMERTPFDGCVFHVNTLATDGKRESFTWLGWGRRTFSEAELKDSIADLQTLAPTRFTQNFLRFNTTPGDLDWFDDYSAVVANARLAGRLAKEGKCRGVLLDIEQYERPLFQYRKLRDAPTKPWEEYAAQARRRGREVMSAFQQAYPGLTVLLTFGHTLPWKHSNQGKLPLAEGEYGLLAPFLDGMIDASEGNTKIIDGYELSYGYKDRVEFELARKTMMERVSAIVGDPEKYARVVRPGFGIWMDFDWRRNGWDLDHPEKNYFTPSSFESSVRAALETTDDIVWIYTETPRWWSPEGKPVKLPDAYDAALRSARTSQQK
jgi:hypothetical protein